MQLVTELKLIGFKFPEDNNLVSIDEQNRRIKKINNIAETLSEGEISDISKNHVTGFRRYWRRAKKVSKRIKKRWWNFLLK